MRPSRRELVLGLGALGLLLGRPRVARAGSARNLVIWFAEGGWDPAMVFDPHFSSSQVDSDPEAELDFAHGIPFANHPERPSVESFFHTWGEQTALVNGVVVGSISHATCMQLALTGSRESARPDLGALLAEQLGASLTLPYLALGGLARPGRLAELVVRPGPRLVQLAGGQLPVAFEASTEREELVRAWLDDEAALLEPEPQLESWISGSQRLRMLDEHLANLAVDPSDPQAQQDLAVYALREGLSRSLILPSPVPDAAAWDSHFANWLNQGRCYEHGFAQLGGFLQALAAQPGSSGSLLDETVVLVMSEMGRLPVLNSGEGKDHWPTTSALVIGAGVQGGRVLGGTDERLVGRGVDRGTGEIDDGAPELGVVDLLAGVAELFDVDPQELYPGSQPLQL